MGRGGANAGNLVIGNGFFAAGSYTLSGTGSVIGYGDEVIASSANGSTGIVGGQFTQNAGTSNFLEGSIDIATATGSLGVYTLNGGTLQTGGLSVGSAGTGIFNQTGGNATVGFTFLPPGFISFDPQFEIGESNGSTGTYNLSGNGSLTANVTAIIGGNGTGTLNQTSVNSNANFSNGIVLGSAGTVIVNSMFVTEYGSGTYNLTSGTLAASYETIGSGG